MYIAVLAAVSVTCSNRVFGLHLRRPNAKCRYVFHVISLNIHIEDPRLDYEKSNVVWRDQPGPITAKADRGENELG